MKLYNLDHSPYSTRVRMQIYAARLEVDIEPPPVELGTPEFNERFPLAKIPVLELDDGGYLGDSWVIMEYLEDMGPAPRLRPEDVLQRSQMLMLARCADTCLGPAGIAPLFANVQNAGGDGNSDMLEALDKELGRLERLLGYLPDFEDRGLTLGDITLVPHMDYALLLAPMFGLSQPLANHPRVEAWHRWALAHDPIARGSEEMHTAVRAFFGG